MTKTFGRSVAAFLIASLVSSSLLTGCSSGSSSAGTAPGGTPAASSGGSSSAASSGGSSAASSSGGSSAASSAEEKEPAEQEGKDSGGQPVRHEKIEPPAVAGKLIREDTGAFGHAFSLYDDGILVVSEGESKGLEVNDLMPGMDDLEDIAKVQTIIVEPGIQYIGGTAFCDLYTNLESVFLPDTVTELRDRCFSGCTDLKTVQLPDSVRMIKNGAFENCHSLEYIDLPDSLEYLEGAFRYCDSLKEIRIPENEELYHTGDETCMGCTALERVELGSYVTEIGSRAFKDCVSLREISTPDEFYSVDDGAFDGCTALEAFYFNGEELDRLGPNAFANCTSLKEFVVPEGVRHLEYHTFYNCTSLEKVTLPSSLTRIYFDAFEGCENLKDIYYEGSKEDWESIEIDMGKTLEDYQIHAEIHFAG